MTHKWTHKRLRASRLILLVLLLTASSVTWVETQIQPHAFAAPSLSPLIWGTNLSLFDRQDLFLTNQQTVNLAAQMHVQLVRFPYRGDLAVTTAAAKQIAAIHATPLLILPYGTDQIATDKILIQMMNTVFDTQTVYYEYGNEPDLPANGEIGASAYATSWNNVIPSLQTLTPTGKFVGPVLSKANASYVGTFLSAATPRPDAVSWHEYTCGAQDANQMCLDNITHWSTHLRETQATMQAARGEGSKHRCLRLWIGRRPISMVVYRLGMPIRHARNQQAQHLQGMRLERECSIEKQEWWDKQGAHSDK